MSQEAVSGLVYGLRVEKKLYAALPQRQEHMQFGVGLGSQSRQRISEVGTERPDVWERDVYVPEIWTC